MIGTRKMNILPGVFPKRIAERLIFGDRHPMGRFRICGGGADEDLLANASVEQLVIERHIGDFVAQKTEKRLSINGDMSPRQN